MKDDETRKKIVAAVQEHFNKFRTFDSNPAMKEFAFRSNPVGGDEASYIEALYSVFHQFPNAKAIGKNGAFIVA